MKKIFAVMLLSVFSLPFLTAQESMFVVGDKVINVGIGFGNVLHSGFGMKTTVPPLSLSFEKGIKDGILEKGVIGVGGYLGYSASKFDYVGYGWKTSNLIIGARGTFHYPLIDNFDTYFGVILGYNIYTSKGFGVYGTYVDPSNGGLYLGGCLGGRYYFNEKFAVMGELYGIAWINLGIAIKL